MDENQFRRRRRNRRQLAAIATIAAVVTAFPHVFCRGQRLEVSQSGASATRQLTLAGASHVTDSVGWYYFFPDQPGEKPPGELKRDDRWYILADGAGLGVFQKQDSATGEMIVHHLVYYPTGIEKGTGFTQTEIDGLTLPQAKVWFIGRLYW